MGRSAPASIHALLEGAWTASRLHALAGLTDGVVLADRDGHIVFANPVADALLGRVRRGAGIDDYSCMHGVFTMEGRPYPSEDLPLSRAILGCETTRDVPLNVRRPDGVCIPLLVSGQPLFDGNGVLVGGVVLFRAAVVGVEAAPVRRGVLKREAREPDARDGM
ncbi:PAS domain-containing protein [Luteibacter sp. UNCMF331Sha3.1]|nr:PAS domain-containing protein [Luteibacter sp. UNCMF331Sha3.1]